MKLEALCKSLLQNRWYCTTNNKFRQFTEAWQQAPGRKQFVLIMRISVILLFVCAQHVSANSFSQKVTLKANKMPLTQVFNSIKQQTGYSFFWDQQLLDKAPLITVSVTNFSLTDALDECLKGLALAYEVKGKIVMITPKKTETSFSPESSLLFQPPPAYYTVSGTVKDENGLPLPRATVVLEPLNMQTVTNEKGEYRFSAVPVGHYNMEISYIGYQKGVKNFIVENASVTMNVKMQSELNEQDELVINTGYQRLKKSSATGSVSVITSKDIEQTPSVNLMERLEGKVPGVMFDVRNNKIQIRGANSWATASDPLIVVDGFPYITNDLTNISATNFSFSSNNPLNRTVPAYSGNSILSSFNPSDIESINFLKDAAAAAIWGANAANGVIVIETKKGRRNAQPTVNLNTTFSTSSPANLKNINAMSSKDYVALEQELFDKNFYTDPITNYRNTEVSEAVDLMFRAKRGEISKTQLDAGLATLSNRSNNDQLKQYLLQQVISQQYNLSVSGGSENSSYHVSGNYTKNRPVYKANQAESYFLTTNITNDFLNKHLSMSAGLNYNYSKSIMNTAAVSGLSAGRLGLAPYDMLTDDNGNPIERGLTFTKRISDSLIGAGHLPWTYNPIDELNYNNTIYAKTAIRANLSLTGKFTDWLNLQVSGQLQRNTDQQDNLQELNSLPTRELVNTGTWRDTLTGKQVFGVPKGGIYKSSVSNTEDYGLRAQLNVNKSWEGKHQLNVIAGSEIRQTKGIGSKQTRYGYDPTLSTSVAVNPLVSYNTMYVARNRPNSATIGYTDGTLYKNRRRYLSYYSNASYSFLNKYFLSASARFDDYSLVGVRRSQRGTPLWSAGAKWDIRKESFMKRATWLDNLGLRVTYGTAGSIPSSVSAYTVVSLGSVDSYTQLPYATIQSPGNPTLTWQTTRTFNTGVDADFFKNRLSVSLDIYNKYTYNIVIGVPYNSTFGFSSLSYNTANMTNHGLEVNLTGQVLRLKDWKWTSNLNFSYNTNKITDNRYPVNTSSGAAASILTTGLPIDNLFAYRWAGLDNTGQPLIYNAKGAKVSGANFPTIAAADMVYVGRTTPPYFGGFTNTVQYKNWSLSARAVYYLGHKFLKQDLSMNHYPQGTSISGRLSTSNALIDRWRKPGDELMTNVPGISNVNSNSVNWYTGSDINVRDGGNVRLQQVTLSYMMPQALLRRIPVFKAASISGSATNLGIIWRKNKDGIDPDYVMTGEYNNLPPTANYVINLNLTF
jgi:TonB-linked SusC/RagA family outer membrane protein